MKFRVESRGTIKGITPREKHVIISISDDVDMQLNDVGSDTTQDVLFLHFHDTNDYKPGFTTFNVDHADKILDFYQRYVGETEMFIAHCYAGMCRSPAVIAALQKINMGNDDVWFKTKRPNSLVYNILLMRAYERGIYKI